MFVTITRIFRKLFLKENDTVSYAIVGIGNKGVKYHNTRHNIGFDVIDQLTLSMRHRIQKRLPYAKGFIGAVTDNTTALCVKPDTYVNRSGVAVEQILSIYKIPTSSCIVVVDDFNLPLGKLRLRHKGSSGGHKGLQSIIDYVGNDFPRLRVGIGPLPRDTRVTEFVLGKFQENEMKLKDTMVKRAQEAIRCYLDQGIEKAMSKFNI